MLKQSLIIIVIAYIAHLYLKEAAPSLEDAVALITTESHPALNWYIVAGSSNNSSNAPATTPFVTIENILPSKLLSAVLAEIKSSIKAAQIDEIIPSIKYSCTLKRDGGACGEERWIDFSHEDARRYFDGTSYYNFTTPEDSLIEKDLMEQAILHIAKYDLVHVLPRSISKHVSGVSWRILISTTGHNHNVFHYDSDEATDYAMQDVPIINPILSTVTYLSDSGEPTLIIDTSQLANDTIYHPRNAFISMPMINKHLAFDSRLFHGSSGALFAGKEGDVRIAIGTNFHTQRSLETIFSKKHRLMKQYVRRPLEVRVAEATPPIDMRGCTEASEHERVIKSWSTSDNVDMELSRENWTPFQLKTNHRCRSFFASNRYKRSNITMRLPIDFLLAQARQEPGCTLRIGLERNDFNVSHHKNESYRPKPKIRNKEAKLVAREMLIKRCEVFPNDFLSMNPALAANIC